jgi:hypothetical protein
MQRMIDSTPFWESSTQYIARRKLIVFQRHLSPWLPLCCDDPRYFDSFEILVWYFGDIPAHHPMTQVQRIPGEEWVGTSSFTSPGASNCFEAPHVQILLKRPVLGCAEDGWHDVQFKRRFVVYYERLAIR